MAFTRFYEDQDRKDLEDRDATQMAEEVVGEATFSDSDDEPLMSPVIPMPVKPAKKKSKNRSNDRVVTLHTMNKSSSSDDEEQGQAFYAGGSERSGQQVLGPPRRRPNRNIVDEIFRSAQESGAEIIDPRTDRHGASSSSRFGSFLILRIFRPF